jgi:arginyl-tRNA synthetase
MEDLKTHLTEAVCIAIEKLYGKEAVPAKIDWQITRKEFAGDLTLVVFPYTRFSKKGPEQTAEEVGQAIASPYLQGFNVVKGFLNLEISKSYWLESFLAIEKSEDVVSKTANPVGVMVEYSSPNTNKPLHLGHIRNCLLGWSVGNIQEAVGNKVTRVQIINDRGIHICKSMVAWQRYANGETPESAGMKGDHLVGKYYVVFDKHYREEVAELVAQGASEDEAKEKASIMVEAREMLRKWEDGDKEVVNLWNTMNSWVYAGFDETYQRLGVAFDKNYYESNTYKLGKSMVEEGLSKGIFTRQDDGSVWIDLTEEGLDRKILLRSDGTSVYMTQDMGTAVQRFEDYPIEKLIYTVGNEQDYHFQVLFAILKKMGYSWVDGLFHLSYGMVDLPTGKMKSREGKVVDADDLITDMETTAEQMTNELGKADGLGEEEKRKLYYQIGMGALKYFILKVDPKKRMTFNPEESIDLQGNTGPFIQYTHARIQSLLRKGGELNTTFSGNIDLLDEERELIKFMMRYSEVVHQAAKENSPALIANYAFDLVKMYNGYYQNFSILRNEDTNVTAWRLMLSGYTARIIRHALTMLGIESPNQM